MPAVTLGEKVWEGIEWILRAGFKPYWLLCDGGEPNRSFIKMCFEDPEKENFVTYNIKNGQPLVIMADCKLCKTAAPLTIIWKIWLFCRRSSMENHCFKIKQQKGMGKITDIFEILVPDAMHFHVILRGKNFHGKKFSCFSPFNRNLQKFTPQNVLK